MQSLLKRLARLVLREELQRRDRVLAGCQQMLRSASEDRTAARRDASQLRDRLLEMRQWGIDTGYTTLLAWYDLITRANSDPSGHGIVHPFDRWGVSPKPKQESAVCTPVIPVPRHQPSSRSSPASGPAPTVDTSDSLTSDVLFGSLLQSSSPYPSPEPELFRSGGGGDFGGGGASGSWSSSSCDASSYSSGSDSGSCSSSASSD